VIPLLDLHDLQEARFQSERQAFTRRHRQVSLPWVMFCIGFALGVGIMLAATN
jgi:hypothetical protein